MRLLCFFAFFIFAVFTSNAENIVRNGTRQTIRCNDFTSSILFSEPMHWKSNYIYPVLICIKLNGAISACRRPEPLQIKQYLYAEGRSFEMDLFFDPEDFYASQMARCRLVHASELAEPFKDRGVIDSASWLLSRIYGNPESTTTPTYELTVRALTYSISQPTSNIKATPSKDPTVHAVICSFPNCVVVADGFSATRTEFFTIRKGETPQYTEWSGPVTEGMFSVTSFECEPGNCPTKFNAFNLAEPATKTALKSCLNKCVP